VTMQIIGRALMAAIMCAVAPANGATVGRPAASAPEPIRLGQSAPLSGPTAALGTSVRLGVLAAIEEVNRAGGVRGRPVELLSLDDEYEPRRTAANTRELIEKRGVLAVIGSVGAPCAVTAVPIAQERSTLLYGYVTGGAVLRKSPPDRYVVNYRASLAEEVGLLVDHFVSRGVAAREIAFFTQQDAFGDAAFAGGMAALKRHGLSDGVSVRHVRYERNTIDIESGLSELLLMQPQPRAVIFGGAADPLVAFVREGHKADFVPMVGTVSFVDAVRVAELLGASAEGMVISQVVPPLTSDVPVLEQYRAALAATAARAPPSYASLEGYISARALLAALAASTGELTRQAAVDAVRGIGAADATGGKGGLDLGLGPGHALRMRADGHTIGGHLWLTEIRSSQVVPVGTAGGEKRAGADKGADAGQ
jgi:branched-chain amino acid transport system substrate-binding protein